MILRQSSDTLTDHLPSRSVTNTGNAEIPNFCYRKLAATRFCISVPVRIGIQVGGNKTIGRVDTKIILERLSLDDS